MLDPPSSPTPSHSSSNTIIPMAQAMEVDANLLSSSSSTLTSLDFLTSISKEKTDKGYFISMDNHSKLMDIMEKEQYNIFKLSQKQKDFQKKYDLNLSLLSQKIENLEKNSSNSFSSFPPSLPHSSSLQNQFSNSPLSSSIHAPSPSFASALNSKRMGGIHAQNIQIGMAPPLPQPVESQLTATTTRGRGRYDVNDVIVAGFPGTSTGSMPAPQPVYRQPARAHHAPLPPPNRVINSFKPGFFIIRKIKDTSPFMGMSPAQITIKVNQTLRATDTQIDDTTPQVKGVAILQSGDFKFFTQNHRIASWLLQNKHTWTHLSDPALLTKPITFPVIINSVPISFHPENINHLNEICLENDINPSQIENIRWLGNPHDKKKLHGSIVINFKEKHIASQIEKGGLFFQSLYMKGAHYVKSPTQCFNCLEVGHTHSFCKNKPLCSKCGEEHNTQACIGFDLDSIRCYRCINLAKSLNPTPDTEINCDDLKFNHSPMGNLCPIKNKHSSMTNPLNTVNV